MKNSLQMGQECVQSAPLAKCDRKTLELALKELVSSNNKFRQQMIQDHPNKEDLEKVLVIKRAHHAFLKQLFDRCDFKKTFINTEDNKVYPSLRGVSDKLNYSKSHLYSIKRHLREIGLIKSISRRIEISPDGETRTTSDEYFFGQRILDLAELTALARKTTRSDGEKKIIEKLIGRLDQKINIEESAHQKNGKKGFEKRKRINDLIENLNKIIISLETSQTKDQEENLKKLRKIGYEFKKINGKTCSKNQTPRVRKNKPRVLKFDPPGLKIIPEILPIKSSHEILNINTPPPVQNSKNQTSDKTKNIPSKNEEEEFEKIFEKYSELFERKPSLKEKKLFKENHQASGWTSEEILELLNHFEEDRYLKATTTSINRLFDAERVFSMMDTVKTRLLKEEYDMGIIKPLGPISILKKIFSGVPDILKWANGEKEFYSDGK